MSDATSAAHDQGASETSAPGHGGTAGALSEENVALRVAWEMQRRSWSQERMAQELTNAGCPTHQSAISKIVNPKPGVSRRAISVAEAIAMAKVFDVPLAELPLPPEAAEGRDLHELSRTVTHEGRNARDRYSHFLLAWGRLRHRLSQGDGRTVYNEFLQARRVDSQHAETAIDTWQDADSWHAVAAGYDTLNQTLQTLGNGRDLTPPTQDELRRRHNLVSDLLRLRELFATKIPGSPVRVVPDLLYHLAEVMVRARMLEAAIPVIDSYACGIAHSTDEVVAEIDRRLQEIVDRDPQDHLDYLESLAARIALRWQGNEPRKPVEDLAAQLGVTVDDYRDAKRMGGVYRATGVR